MCFFLGAGPCFDLRVIPFVFERNPLPRMRGILFSEDGEQNDTQATEILDARAFPRERGETQPKVTR
jgi:hypothetical protein